MRARGEGTLRKRPNGVSEGRLTVDGKQLSFYSKVQREVLRRMREARDSAENNEPLQMPSQQRTLAHLVDEWLATKKLRNNTLAAYRAYLKNHILPALGPSPVPKLTPGTVERFLASRRNKATGEPLSPKSQQQLRAILQSALSFAVKEGYVRRNVAQLADAAEVIPTKISPFTPHQVPALLQAISGTRLEALYCLMLGTGMREGECLGLTLDDLDLEQRIVHVRRTLERDQDGNYCLPELAKNKTSYRDIHVPASIVPKLEKWLGRREEERKTAREEWEDPWGLLFVTPSGRPLHRSTVLHDFQRLIISAGLPASRSTTSATPTPACSST